MDSLSIKKVSFAYEKNKLVLNNINLSFEGNYIHTLLGLNGSGKTTLIKILAGLFTPIKGTVYLDERNLKDINFHERSKLIAYVSQDASTGDDHYVHDYLSFGAMNRLTWYQSPKDEILNRVLKIAEKFNILDLLKRRMDELSGGQKQIVMICRAVIQNTKIIILDEPTSALDFRNQSRVLKLLKEIVKEENKTIILSTHNPNHALYLESNVVLIDEGVIIDYGDSKRIVTKEKLKSVYGDNIDYSKNLRYHEISIL